LPCFRSSCTETNADRLGGRIAASSNLRCTARAHHLRHAQCLGRAYRAEQAPLGNKRTRICQQPGAAQPVEPTQCAAHKLCCRRTNGAWAVRGITEKGKGKGRGKRNTQPELFRQGKPDCQDIFTWDASTHTAGHLLLPPFPSALVSRIACRADRMRVRHRHKAHMCVTCGQEHPRACWGSPHRVRHPPPVDWVALCCRANIVCDLHAAEHD